MIVKLREDEVRLLSARQLLPNHLASKLVESSARQSHHYVLALTEDEADDIRDRCGEELQRIGFNEDYKATEEGRVLESLIDKFFTG